MKSISTALNNHIGSEVTTLCMCWKIVRTDGVQFGFTTHDQDLTIDGLFYDSAHGYTSSAITTNSDLSVDNSDVEGILESDLITDEDLRNGLFNFASIYVFMVNWSDLTQGVLKLRRGWFGEVTVGQNGKFTTELRGLNQALSHNYVEVFTPECRADFCDARCKLNLADFERNATILSVANRRQFTVTALPESTGSTSVGAHRYWRVYVTNNISNDHTGFAEFKAWDQDGNLLTGGSIFGSSDEKHYEVQKARDGNPYTYWSSDNANAENNETYPVHEFWRIDFGSPKDIKEFALTSSPVLTENPTAFRFEYSANGSDWTLAKTCNAPWTATGQTMVWGIGSPTADPINFDSAGDIPEPFEGASNYIGGTVRFVAGANSGRSMEIIDYDSDTGVVTLFEALPYEPSVGDTLKIAQGCDKRKETCVQYENLINFRGEPYVPGQDEFLSYPDSHG